MRRNRDLAHPSREPDDVHLYDQHNEWGDLMKSIVGSLDNSDKISPLASVASSNCLNSCPLPSGIAEYLPHRTTWHTAGSGERSRIRCASRIASDQLIWRSRRNMSSSTYVPLTERMLVEQSDRSITANVCEHLCFGGTLKPSFDMMK